LMTGGSQQIHQSSKPIPQSTDHPTSPSRLMTGGSQQIHQSSKPIPQSIDQNTSVTCPGPSPSIHQGTTPVPVPVTSLSPSSGTLHLGTTPVPVPNKQIIPSFQDGVHTVESCPTAPISSPPPLKSDTTIRGLQTVESCPTAPISSVSPLKSDTTIGPLGAGTAPSRSEILGNVALAKNGSHPMLGLDGRTAPTQANSGSLSRGSTFWTPDTHNGSTGLLVPTGFQKISIGGLPIRVRPPDTERNTGIHPSVQVLQSNLMAVNGVDNGRELVNGKIEQVRDHEEPCKVEDSYSKFERQCATQYSERQQMDTVNLTSNNVIFVPKKKDISHASTQSLTVCTSEGISAPSEESQVPVTSLLDTPPCGTTSTSSFTPGKEIINCNVTTSSCTKTSSHPKVFDTSQDDTSGAYGSQNRFPSERTGESIQSSVLHQPAEQFTRPPERTNESIQASMLPTPPIIHPEEPHYHLDRLSIAESQSLEKQILSQTEKECYSSIFNMHCLKKEDIDPSSTEISEVIALSTPNAEFSCEISSSRDHSRPESMSHSPQTPDSKKSGILLLDGNANEILGEDTDCGISLPQKEVLTHGSDTLHDGIHGKGGQTQQTQESEFYCTTDVAKMEYIQKAIRDAVPSSKFIVHAPPESQNKMSTARTENPERIPIDPIQHSGSNSPTIAYDAEGDRENRSLENESTIPSQKLTIVKAPEDPVPDGAPAASSVTRGKNGALIGTPPAGQISGILGVKTAEGTVRSMSRSSPGAALEKVEGVQPPKPTIDLAPKCFYAVNNENESLYYETPSLQANAQGQLRQIPLTPVEE